MNDVELDKIINALKIKALGNVVEQCIETYKTDENGKKILSDKTIKKLKNDIDTQACIKLIDIELKRREQERELSTYENMSDEELEKERKRLLKELLKEERRKK